MYDNQRYFLLFNNSLSGIATHKLIYDKQNNPINYIITDVNPKFESILSLNKEEVLNKLATEVYKVEKPPYLDIYAKTAFTLKPISFETYYDPMKKYFQISVFSHKKGFFVTVFEDITKRKLKEKKIKHLYSILKAIRNINQLIVRLEDKIKLINGVCEELKEVRDYKFAWITLMDSDQKVTEFAEAGIEEQGSSILETLKSEAIPYCWLKLLDKHKINIIFNHEKICENCPLKILPDDYNTIVLKMENHKRIYGFLGVAILKTIKIEPEELKLLFEVAKDLAFGLYNHNVLTKKNQLKQKLFKSEKKYREAYIRNEFYKDLFTHDINNIFQCILTGIDLINLNRQGLGDSTELNDSISIITKEVLRGKRLIENIQKLSKIEDYEIECEKINPIEIINQLFNKYEYLFPEKSFHFKINTKFHNLYVFANTLLEDIFDNLILNAIQHNDNTQIEVIVKISSYLKNQNKYLKIEFLDNACGINNSLKQDIFLRARINNKGVKRIGLGLTLVKKLIELFNGEIWVEDRIKEDCSKGSNFVVLLPGGRDES
jgi:K+-sensing histidine kinase KdpD